ncbi:hypothetical protein Btru_029656 [Bulinus truncatus]|nr:hypothetical protein Btru_029656 [Bulinus truncatus]
MPPNNFTDSVSDDTSALEAMTSDEVTATSSADYASTLKAMTSTATPFTNHTYLMELQDKSTVIMVPSMAYLATLCVIGLIGNSLVLFIYTRKFKKTPTRTFILAIAGLDLIINVVVIPAELYNMLHHWNMRSDLFCKTFMYVSAFTFIVSAMTLVAVAVARYTESFKPNKKQLTLRDAEILCAVMSLASLAFSVPFAIVGGLHRKHTPEKDLYGQECGIDGAYAGRIWPTANAAFLIVVFISCCAPMLLLYLIMCCKLWRGDHVYSVAADGCGAGVAPPPAGDDPKGGLPVVTARSRSYIKKKSTESQAGPKAASAEVKVDGGVGGDDEDRKGLDPQKNNLDPHVDGNHQVEIVGSNFQARMIRSPTGEKVKVNLSMVRELTVKLKAVQKQAEERLAKETDQLDVSKEGQELLDGRSGEANNRRAPTTAEDGHLEMSSDLDEKDSGKGQGSETNLLAENEVTSNDIPRPRDNDIREEITGSASERSASKSEPSDGSEMKVTTTDEVQAQNGETVHEKTEISDESDDKFGSDPIIPNDDKSYSDCIIPNNDKVDSNSNVPTDEHFDSFRPTDFARAMQWIDITYCQQSENRAPDPDEEGGGIDPASLMKKGSFMSSRKVSRDNSFLRKHRKLRDALTDTLTRARKSKKDREDSKHGGSSNDVSDKQNDRISEDVNDTGHQDADHLGHHNNEALSPNKATSHADYSVDKRSEGSTGIPHDESSRQVNERGSRGGCAAGLGRTTCMMLIVSLIYVIGALPYLALNFTRFEMPGAFQSADNTGEALYQVIIRAHLLSSAVKPIIYAMCNFKFRRAFLSVHKHS